MQVSKRVDLEEELYIFQRADIKNTDRWYCSFKLKGVKRINKALGVMSEEKAAKEARRELQFAEEQIRDYGVHAVLGRNTIIDAFNFFKNNGENYVSHWRYGQITRDWKNHWLSFFGRKTVIDKRLQKRMGQYVEWRRKKGSAAPSTLKVEIVSAKQLLKIAREAGGIGSDVGNLTIEVKKKSLQQNSSKTTTFTDQEVGEIEAHFDREANELKGMLKRGELSHAARSAKRRLHLLERLRFFVAIMFATGTRVNEARQIRHCDLQEDFQILRVRRSKTRKGTNRNAFVENEIWDIKKAYGRYMNYCKTKKTNSLVFAEEEGKIEEQEPKVLTNVGHSFQKFLRRNQMLSGGERGRYKRNFYSTRHYFITKKLRGDSPLAAVAKSVGTSIKMIDETYYDGGKLITIETMTRKKTAKKRARKHGSLELVE